MQAKLDDYANHLALTICHELRRIGYWPIPGARKAARLLSSLVPKPNPAGRCIIKSLHGFRMLVDPVADKGLERTLFVHGTYEEGTLRIIRQLLTHGGDFIDAGANVGLMSLHAARILGRRGRVLSFEPLPSTYAMLVESIRLNHFENIEAVQLALGSTNGTVEVFENLGVNRGSSSLIKPKHAAASHKVPVRRLDEYLAEHPTGRIACVKIDVEGWELEVLKGAATTLSGRNAPVCIVECSTLHPVHGGNTEDICAFVRNVNSYRTFRLARGKEVPSRLVEIKSAQELPKHDNLFCLLPEHIEKLPRRMFN